MGTLAAFLLWLLLASPAAAQGQPGATTTNALPGSVWTYFGPTFGAGWLYPVSGLVPGVVGDGVTDNCAAITKYITSFAGGSKIALLFPTGVFVSTCGMVFNNISVAIHGVGPGVTEIRFTGNNDGVTANTSVHNTVLVSDIALTTNKINQFSALKVSYTASGFANRDLTKLVVRNVLTKGVDQKVQSWNKCHDINDVNTARFEGIDCIGIQGPGGTTSDAEAANTVTSYGIYVTGANFPTDYKITNSLFTSLVDSFNSTNSKGEGFRFTGNTFVNVKNAVVWTVAPADQGRPQIVFSDNHVNSYAGCVVLTGVSESIISNNLFYHSPGSTSAQTCVTLANTNNVQVLNNQFENFSTKATTGVWLSSVAGYSTSSFNNRIAGNMFGSETGPGNYNQAIFVEYAGATFVGTNRFGGGVAAAITDIAKSAGQQTAFGRHFMTLKRGAGQSIPSGATTTVQWDVVEYQTFGWKTFAAPENGIVIPANQPNQKVKCTATIQFETNATGFRVAQMTRNGVLGPTLPVVQRMASPFLTTDMSLASGIISVNAGDVISVQVIQDSGVTIGITPQLSWISCEYVE